MTGCCTMLLVIIVLLICEKHVVCSSRSRVTPAHTPNGLRSYTDPAMIDATVGDKEGLQTFRTWQRRLSSHSSQEQTTRRNWWQMGDNIIMAKTEGYLLSSSVRRKAKGSGEGERSMMKIDSVIKMASLLKGGKMEEKITEKKSMMKGKWKGKKEKSPIPWPTASSKQFKVPGLLFSYYDQSPSEPTQSGYVKLKKTTDRFYNEYFRKLFGSQFKKVKMTIVDTKYTSQGSHILDGAQYSISFDATISFANDKSINVTVGDLRQIILRSDMKAYVTNYLQLLRQSTFKTVYFASVSPKEIPPSSESSLRVQNVHSSGLMMSYFDSYPQRPLENDYEQLRQVTEEFYQSFFSKLGSTVRATALDFVTINMSITHYSYFPDGSPSDNSAYQVTFDALLTFGDPSFQILPSQVLTLMKNANFDDYVQFYVNSLTNTSFATVSAASLFYSAETSSPTRSPVVIRSPVSDGPSASTTSPVIPTHSPKLSGPTVSIMTNFPTVSPQPTSLLPPLSEGSSEDIGSDAPSSTPTLQQSDNVQATNIPPLSEGFHGEQISDVPSLAPTMTQTEQSGAVQATYIHPLSEGFHAEHTSDVPSLAPTMAETDFFLV